MLAHLPYLGVPPAPLVWELWEALGSSGKFWGALGMQRKKDRHRDRQTNRQRPTRTKTGTDRQGEPALKDREKERNAKTKRFARFPFPC